MENLKLYESIRTPPKNALKPIKGGRLSGYTDINPMWRIKTLTEKFGPCGIGWKYVITKQWLEEGGKGEVAAFTNIDLYTKHKGEWSEAVPGTGGSMFVASERNGLYTSDECFKMSLTDAISVACKNLGMAADIYWDNDRTKYDNQPKKQSEKTSKNQTQNNPISKPKANLIKSMIVKTKTNEKDFLNYCKVGKVEDLNEKQFENALNILNKKQEKQIGEEKQ